MRVSKEHKEKTRQKILKAAGRGFREEGYGGLGVDGLAKRAGLTSGAFYGHFSSKDEAFKEAVIQGIQDYTQAVVNLEVEHGENWTKEFLDYYLGKSHVDDMACGCVVPGLSAEVMRADANTKKAYENEIKKTAENISTRLKEQSKDNAWALMAMLAGSVMMARCIDNEDISDEILKSVKNCAEKLLSSS